MAERQVFVYWADLELRAEDDPGAPEAAVTIALCGHWEHDPPCRWPHNNNDPTADGVFRTVFAAVPAEESEVRARVEGALRARPWRVRASGPRDPDADELALGQRIAETR